MNQRPQPLPASVPPCTGEHLGSWLSRVAAIYDVSVADLFNHCHIPGPVRGRCWITLPVLQSDQLRLFAQRLRMPMATLKAMNATDWSMTSPIGEVGYCPRCFEADQRAGHPLYWRLAWLDGFNTWCLEHRVPLNTTAAAPLNNIRNWARVRVSSFTTFAPKSNRCDATIEDAAYKLQLAVSDGISPTLRQSMYASYRGESGAGGRERFTGRFIDVGSENAPQLRSDANGLSTGTRRMDTALEHSFAAANPTL